MSPPQTEVIVTTADGGQWRQALGPGVYIIGRDADADLCIEDELISQRHARLVIHPGEVFIEDLNSANGTLAGDSPVTAMMRLWPGQRIQLGGASIEVRLCRPSDDPEASLTPMSATLRRALPEDSLREHKYEIGGVVAQGGMGAILNAREAAIQRTVAMKVMLNADSPESLLRFIGEAKVTGQLEHPCIVPIYELSVNEQEQVFYTMKFVRGVTLREVLWNLLQGDAETVKKYPLPQLLTVFQKVCDAVAFAHSRRVIHRDLKPENIMLGDFGEVLVMDWGLAKVIGASETAKGDTSANQDVAESLTGASMTLAGSIMGTPQFMSPEQANGDVESLDERTDIYALGAILYHILTLHPPVAGEDVNDILEKVRSGAIAPPAKIYAPPKGVVSHLPGGRVPASLAAVAMKAMALRPENRYGRAADLQADVTAYQNGFATQAENAGLFKQLSLLIRRHKALAASAAVLLVVSAAFMAKIVASERRATETLGRLRGTAPIFYEQAQALIQEQKFKAALEKLSYAVDLVPENGDYQATRGNVLQSLRRFGEAAKAYELAKAAKPELPFVEENRELSARLAEETRGGQPLSEGSLRELANLIGRQDRPAEATLLFHHTQRSFKELLDTWRARLAKCGRQGWERVGTESFRLKLDKEGLFTLDVHATNVSDISPLRGMPLRSLNFAQTNDIHDFSPLAGLPLEELHTGACSALNDLSPLKGMKLRTFHLEPSAVADLSVLVGMPIEDLKIRHCPIEDFELIRGFPLRQLSVPTTSFRDLTLVENMQLTHLDVSSTKVKDLNPLRGMKLVSLDLDNTPVSDLSPLEGMPLKELFLGSTPKASDFQVIAGLKDLEWLILPRNVRDIEFLRQHPKLKRIGINLKAAQRKDTPTAEEFWKAWDARGGKR